MFSVHIRDTGTLAAPFLKLSDIPEPVLSKQRRDDEDEDEDKENRLPKQQKSEWDSSDDEPVVSNGPISPVPVYSCPREIRYVHPSYRRPRGVLVREESFGVYGLFICESFI